MLEVVIPKQRLFNSKTNEFYYIPDKDVKLQLEHSLVSISKWEQKWHKPFLSDKPKTNEETLDYIRCMCMTSNVNPEVYKYIPESITKEIDAYISDPMTATTFSDEQKGGKKEIMTNELIYWQMITLNIPVEFQKWHLNRLLTLIKVCSIKNNPNKKKMSRNEIIQRNRALNKARRAALNSAG